MVDSHESLLKEIKETLNAPVALVSLTCVCTTLLCLAMGLQSTTKMSFEVRNSVSESGI